MRSTGAAPRSGRAGAEDFPGWADQMNPLLDYDFLIPFDRIRPEHVVPAVRQALADAERELEAIATEPGPRGWDNTLRRLDELEERLDRVTNPVTHLVSVMNTP